MSRLYICGIRKDCHVSEFHWLEVIEGQPVERFLDTRDLETAQTGLPPESAKTATTNALTAIAYALEKEVGPTIAPLFINCDTSTSRPKKPMYNRTPCMTYSRSQGHWLTNRGRRVNKAEMRRLQGFNPEKMSAPSLRMPLVSKSGMQCL